MWPKFFSPTCVASLGEDDLFCNSQYPGYSTFLRLLVIRCTSVAFNFDFKWSSIMLCISQGFLCYTIAEERRYCLFVYLEKRQVCPWIFLCCIRGEQKAVAGYSILVSLAIICGTTLFKIIHNIISKRSVPLLKNGISFLFLSIMKKTRQLSFISYW